MARSLINTLLAVPLTVTITIIMMKMMRLYLVIRILKHKQRIKAIFMSYFMPIQGQVGPDGETRHVVQDSKTHICLLCSARKKKTARRTLTSKSNAAKHLLVHRDVDCSEKYPLTGVGSRAMPSNTIRDCFPPTAAPAGVPGYDLQRSLYRASVTSYRFLGLYTS